MPKVKISEYSATANSNTDVASINIDEGCAPSGINNAIRAVMGHLKDFQQGTNGDPFNGPVNGTLGATTASTANVTTLTTSSTVTHNGGTANGVAYLNGSKVLTTGSALVFDGSNFGVGNAPAAWSLSGLSAVQVKDVSLAGFSNAMYLNNNVYYNGGWKFIGTGYGLQYTADRGTGAYSWNISTASGTAGNAITFTQAMTLDASGNLGVGTTSPASFFSSADNLVVGTTSGNNGITILGGSTATAVLAFGYAAGTSAGDASNRAKIWYDGTSDTLRMSNGGSLMNASQLVLDASGNLLVGTASRFSGFAADNKLYVESSTGDYICHFRSTQGTPYGPAISFSTAPNNATSLFIDARDSSAQRFAVRSNGGIANYTANDVNLSDRREKTNFAPAKSYLDVICAIPVQTFNYIDQNMEDDAGLTLGVVAQDVQSVAPELVMESNWGTEEEPKMRLSIYQTDLQYALMKCIQEQQALITQLTARITALESA